MNQWRLLKWVESMLLFYNSEKRKNENVVTRWRVHACTRRDYDRRLEPIPNYVIGPLPGSRSAPQSFHSFFALPERQNANSGSTLARTAPA
mmetsp:Transcript_6056/g.9458  ORF Transcript_6056/g.9458 Transcript_6056/m.9458 type:complete len:91 (+) Transcript_6056:950-1222(+)